MAEVRVQLPLGALQSPERTCSLADVNATWTNGTVCFGLVGRTWESLVFRVPRAHEIAGSTPAVLTLIAVGPVLVRAGAC